MGVGKPFPLARSILWRPASGGPPPAADLVDPLFFGPAALAALYDHLATVAAAAEAKGGGVLGFLIGDVAEDPETGAPYFVIDACVRFKQAVFGDRTGVVVGKLWDPVQRQLARSQARLIGWYHSHPPRGIELTSEDVATHEQYFDEQWHVALVLGTLDDEPAAGFYRPGSESGTDVCLPFYELLQEDPLAQGGKQRSSVTWKNYRAVDPKAPAPKERKSGPRPELSLPTLPSLESWHEPSAIPDLGEPTAPAASDEAQAPSEEAPEPPLPPPPPPPPRAARRTPSQPIASPPSDLPFLSLEDSVAETIEQAAPPPPPPFPSAPPEPRPAKQERKKVKRRRRLRVPRAVWKGAIAVIVALAAAGAYWRFVHLTPAQVGERITKVAVGLADRAVALFDRAAALVARPAAPSGRRAAAPPRTARPAPQRPAPTPQPAPITQPAPPPPPPASPPPLPAPRPAAQRPKLDVVADSVARALRGYQGQANLFAQRRLDCAGLARELAAVESRWLSYSAERRAVRAALDPARAATERSLYASVDSVERGFDRTGCPRP
ncbi:MAG: hypothetical protein DMD53_05615 [Gemmatimonadetes bacterium]|nr:MAG: hypothetical protein DMD53_05615 [Gemmatimonadota bacterium]